jgi:hypothetical protein
MDNQGNPIIFIFLDMWFNPDKSASISVLLLSVVKETRSNSVNNILAEEAIYAFEQLISVCWFTFILKEREIYAFE